VPEADVQAEIDRARERYKGNPRLLGYFESDRGRSFIRSSLRRSQTVEKLVDDWLAAHPDHPALPHAEGGEGSREPTAGEAASDSLEPVEGADSDTTSTTDDGKVTRAEGAVKPA
jgi:hypothetical protein